MARRIRPAGARSSPLTHTWRGPRRRMSTSRTLTGFPLVAGRSLYSHPRLASADFGETLAGVGTVVSPESIGSARLWTTKIKES
jgi:hypothetical protein